MKVYTFNNIEMVHIAEIAPVIHRSVRYIRHLIEEGNQIRPMKYFRDRSRVMLPIVELKGYPFTASGRSNGTPLISHLVQFEEGWMYQLCDTCTYSDVFCTARQAAEDLNVPRGDP